MSAPLEKQVSDLPIGQLQQGKMAAQVSVRGGVVMLAFQNTETQRGFEVAFSPQAVEKLNDYIAQAGRLARGTVLV